MQIGACLFPGLGPSPLPISSDGGNREEKEEKEKNQKGGSVIGRLEDFVQGGGRGRGKRGPSRASHSSCSLVF